MICARPMSYYESPDDDEAEWELHMIERGFTYQEDGSWVNIEGNVWSPEWDALDVDEYDLE